MKKLLCTLSAISLSLFLTSGVSAEVASSYEEQTNWKITCPVVKIEENPDAAAAINEDLMGYIHKLKENYDAGRYFHAGGKYIVHYEDSQILSISLILFGYPYGANGNHSYSVDRVYDKSTGEAIPLDNYVHALPEDLEYYKSGHTYNFRSQLIPWNQMFNTRITFVPDNYFLEGHGIVCIVFQPYYLACGAAGQTYIRLMPDYIDYLNRKNQR